MSSPYDRLKEGQRWLWSLGDYTRLAEVLEPHAESLAGACDIRRGTNVLDVAAGNGNLALAAARRGAVVTATDLTPHMVELGRERSSAAGATITWSEADAEQLPFDDGTFDVVASVFGAMFAPRPQLVASEMIRVARPGGLVAMANYGPGGFLGRLADLIAGFSAHPSFELPSPFAWGDEAEVRRRLAGASSIEVTHHTLHFESESVTTFVKFWEDTNAPQTALRTMLPPDAYEKLIDAERRLVEELNESRDGRVRLSSPYILVLARK